jgi:EAL domain-containing protein (putative c-di-GMP-specific phosphodiesterase class I)
LIRAAKEAGRLGELDWLCRTRAIRAALEARLPDKVSWQINVEPAALGMECPPSPLAEHERACCELRVILEIVERDVDGRVLDLIRGTDGPVSVAEVLPWTT